METNQTLLNKVITQPLGKIITAALVKLKNLRAPESGQTGIQFYGDLDD